MASDVGTRESRRRVRVVTGRRVRDALILGAFGAAVAAAVVAPLTRRGWVLLLDWVPGPRVIGATGRVALPTGPAFLVPMQGIHALFGAATGWLAIALALGLAATGAAVMVGPPWPARIAAGLLFAWNPFVYDRIYAGQVGVLTGYALLPWLAWVALRVSRLRGALVLGLVWAIAVSCSLHDAWIGGVLVLAIAVVRLRRDGVLRVLAGLAIASALTAVLVAAWLVPTRQESQRETARVLHSFQTTSDPSLGRSVGLLALQGFWRTSEARPRDDLGHAFPILAGAVIASAIAGLVLARGTRRARLAAALALAGLAGWLLAHGDAGPIGGAYRWMFRTVPGFGVMREAQKWDALVALALAAGLGCFAAALARAELRPYAWLVVALPVAFAPTLAWGLDGRVVPSHYPASWARVRTAVDRVDGDVVVLPWQEYVLPGFTGNRTVAQPATGFFGRSVIASTDAQVAGLESDTGRRARIAKALQDAREAADAGRPVHLAPALRALGVGGVLVTTGTGGVPLDRDADLHRIAHADNVALWVVDPH